MAQAKCSKPGSAAYGRPPAEEPHTLAQRPHFPDPVDGGAGRRGHACDELRRGPGPQVNRSS